MFTLEERTLLLAHARSSVRTTVLKTGDRMPPHPGHPALETPAGAFTTLHDAGGRLRGCIGFVEARFRVWETVWRTAAEAALEDPRFDPVAPPELAGLSYEISILSALRRAAANEVRAGLHGVLLSRGGRRGLLLPQVATEHGWDTETFLDACCEKAGLARGSWRAEAKIEVFTAEVISE
ncbi:MAG: AmmeMemoRadiSam system protein A [Planctomycetes bacterium]|nr:AmmeMemoRadiSam system protein A [Planctomycetota bacterium]